MQSIKRSDNELDKLQSTIQYQFNDVKMLKQALTHSSYANESKKKNIPYNERLEFLGDSVLGLVVSDYIFKKYMDLPEGELTKVRANVVCEPTLSSKAKEINLGKYLLLGKGEEITGGRERVSILADAYEALIGALYIDGGLDTAKEFILNSFYSTIEQAVKGKLFRDYKTHLQELLQSKYTDKISYQVVKEEGPDHDKTFTVEVSLCNQVLGRGKGKSKKEAEQNAAEEALEKVRFEHV